MSLGHFRGYNKRKHYIKFGAEEKLPLCLPLGPRRLMLYSREYITSLSLIHGIELQKPSNFLIDKNIFVLLMR